MTTRRLSNRWLLWTVLCAGGFSLGGCGEAAAPAPGDVLAEPDTAPAAADTDVAEPVAETPALTLRPARAATAEQAVRASFIRARQAEAGEAHHIVRAATALEAENDAHDLALRFEEVGVVLTEGLVEEGQEPWQGSLRFAGIGRGGVRRIPGVDAIQSDKSRVEYVRAGMREWYVNGPLGLEQGFTLEAPEPGTGDVEIAVALDGELVPVWSEERGVVELRDGQGEPVLQISDLFVKDAAGRAVAATFAVVGEEIVLRFDDAGALYPVEVDPLVATPQSTVVANDHQVQSFFGWAVAVDGSRAVVGAPLSESGTGAAYVFVRSGGAWTQEAKVVPPSSADATRTFGFSVAISGSSTIVVGAPQTVNAAEGRAFVFTRSGSTWSRQATLTASDGVSDGRDLFGSSVAIDGNTACVGATDGDYGPLQDNGRVHCFTRSGTTWTWTGALEYAGFPSDLGTSLALMGNTVLAGDPSASNADLSGQPGAGRVWAFERDATGEFVAKGSFASPSPVAGGRFGSTVALAEVTSSTTGTAIVGEPGSNTSRGEASGSARIFRRSGSATFSHERQLVPSTAVADSEYRAVGVATNALTGRLSAAVGSAFATHVALFDRSTSGTWSEASTTSAAPFALDLDPATLALGFPSAPFIGNFAAFMSVRRDNGDTCSGASECGSGFCVDGRCCNSACGDGASDCQACSTSAGGTTNGTCTALTASAAAARTCRASAGTCDVAETCSPSQTTCPTNRFRSSSTECRASAGPCDPAERCTGSSASCPSNALSPSSTVCRSASGACDLAERCNGSSSSCPADGVASFGAECRASTNLFCDPAELCDGATKACPADFSLCF